MTHKWIVPLVYFSGLTILVIIPGLLAPTAMRQAQGLSDDLTLVTQQLIISLDQPVIFLNQSFHPGQLLADLVSSTDEALTPVAENALTIIESTSLGVVWLLVILVGGYYFLLDWEHLRDWLIRLAPATSQEDFRRILKEVDTIWRAYLYGTFILMIAVGVVFTIAWTAIGLPGAVAQGVLMGVLTVIPDVGPALAAIIAVLVAFFQGSNFLEMSNISFAVLVFTIYMVLIQIKAIWIRPRIMGRFLRMNEGVIFIAIIGATVLWGILGALLIVPVLATLGVIGRYMRAKLLHLDPWPLPSEATSYNEESECDEEGKPKSIDITS